jgi:hypothetical protein
VRKSIRNSGVVLVTHKLAGERNMGKREEGRMLRRINERRQKEEYVVDTSKQHRAHNHVRAMR